MKKDSVEKRSGVFRRLWLPVFILALCLKVPFAEAGVWRSVKRGEGQRRAADRPDRRKDVANLNLLIIQEESFQFNIMVTAYYDLLNYYIAFTQTIETALQDFAAQGWYAVMQGMVMELHASQVDQTYRLGQLMDAQIMTEEQARKGDITINGQKRYNPSQLACDIDSTGPGLERAYLISRALNRTLALDDTPHRENATGTSEGVTPAGLWAQIPNSSATGRGSDVNATWQQYVSLYCDYTMGDQGCAPGAAPARRLRRHRFRGNTGTLAPFSGGRSRRSIRPIPTTYW